MQIQPVPSHAELSHPFTVCSGFASSRNVTVFDTPCILWTVCHNCSRRCNTGLGAPVTSCRCLPVFTVFIPSVSSSTRTISVALGRVRLCCLCQFRCCPLVLTFACLSSAVACVTALRSIATSSFHSVAACTVSQAPFLRASHVLIRQSIRQQMVTNSITTKMCHDPTNSKCIPESFSLET